ncbi:hypothetical protein EYW49_13380 [Siculibacillus lacustris]|uniref:Uncharacterized protein n=1 Tax=Siculibacillus lacustris TaxID=1549641 RepID=A0A4Q9VM00_9HYPH|nr:hypothetical protein [Siculibacillus lacustris]TBW36586.1 hypothetical protein EYW49_13380 [Siculibacillus lacustris]
MFKNNPIRTAVVMALIGVSTSGSLAFAQNPTQFPIPQHRPPAAVRVYGEPVVVPSPTQITPAFAPAMRGDQRPTRCRGLACPGYIILGI